MFGIFRGKKTIEPTKSVGGFAFSPDGGSANVDQLIEEISLRIQQISPTELDTYRYIVEECHRFSEGGPFEQKLLAAVAVSPLEYGGEMAKAGKFSRNRPGPKYLDQTIMPDLVRVFGEDRAKAIRAMVFVNFFARNHGVVNSLRLKYAVHYHYNCVSNGHWTYADRWSEVINSIENQRTS